MQPLVTAAFIGLGSNIGDLETNLEHARVALNKLKDTQLGPCSPIYRTEPQEDREQPWFVNQVVRLDCGSSWSAWSLLQALMDIETSMGRVRLREKGPRIIDLDLLLFDAQCLNVPELILPHPQLRKRAFVLVPLRDLAPELVFPDGYSINEALQAISFEIRGRCIRQP
jgi:2-amino-4-hydroxy-6-hydroxymethyldihydropteridine diphosphokinase